MKARRALIRISEQLMKHVLHMPESCSIVGGHVTCRYGWPEIGLVIEDSDLPEVEIPEGAEAPEITPSITHEPEKWLWDWNVKP